MKRCGTFHHIVCRPCTCLCGTSMNVVLVRWLSGFFNIQRSCILENVGRYIMYKVNLPAHQVTLSVGYQLPILFGWPSLWQCLALPPSYYRIVTPEPRPRASQELSVWNMQQATRARKRRAVILVRFTLTLRHVEEGRKDKVRPVCSTYGIFNTQRPHVHNDSARLQKSSFQTSRRTTKK